MQQLVLRTVREEGKEGKEEDKEEVNEDEREEGEGGDAHKEEVVEEGEDKHPYTQTVSLTINSY